MIIVLSEEGKEFYKKFCVGGNREVMFKWLPEINKKYNELTSKDRSWESVVSVVGSSHLSFFIEMKGGLKMTIEKIHKENKRLNLKFNIKIGDKFKLKKDISNFKKGDFVTIKQIHSSFGWVLFKETEQLPQETLKLFDFIELK